MIIAILTSALLGLPVADDHGGQDAAHAEEKKSDQPGAPQDGGGFSRFSEGGQKNGEKNLNAAKLKGVDTKKLKQEAATKKIVDKARDETAEMLDEVRGVISSMERGAPITPDVTIIQKDKTTKQTCDLELPQILAFELQRIRAVRDEAVLMLDIHEKNVQDIDEKLTALEAARQQLDKAREQLEKTLARKSTVDDEKEKERRRLRLLLSSRAMKPKKIAALMEEITIDEARVLLESLPETAQKSVLEALSPERLAVIVSQAKSTKPETTNTSTTSPKESL
jgi:hypothetical protein